MLHIRGVLNLQYAIRQDKGSYLTLSQPPARRRLALPSTEWEGRVSNHSTAAWFERRPQWVGCGFRHAWPERASS